MHTADPEVLAEIFSGSKDVQVSRAQLESIFPHREIAMVPDSGIIMGGNCCLILTADSFSTYTRGHEWYFPMHWTLEFVAFITGFQAAHNLWARLGLESVQYSVPSFMQAGVWVKGPFSPDLTSALPICALVPEGSLKLTIKTGCYVEIYSEVLLFQGKRSARISGVEGKLSTQKFIDRIISISGRKT